MSYRFSRRSIANLDGVNDDLVSVATRAVAITTVDFAIIQGLRTAEEQEAAYLRGASQRRTGGKHQVGLAVDVMACIGDLDHDGDKDENWEEQHYPAIAQAFRTASIELCVPIVWGIVWDRLLSDLSEDLDVERRMYDRRMRRKGYRDWGHFELHAELNLVAT
jgi:peptidoglycan L-alanyl-D-glutamate endopeptidase CwlK